MSCSERRLTSELREKVDRAYQRYQTACEVEAREKVALARAKGEEEAAREAQDFLQRAAQAVQNQAHRQVSKVVSRCLSAVFGGRYSLRIVFERKRGRTEASFRYLKDGQLCDPRTDSGGVMEVASLALRLTSLVLSRPQPRKLLVLDEPFRGLSAENLPRAAELIGTLSRELGVQFLVVTHDDTLKAGDVVEL